MHRDKTRILNLSKGLCVPQKSEIHVWTISVEENVPRLKCLSDLLSSEEIRICSRYMRVEDRKRYIVAHGILRQLLGGYLTVPPENLEFSKNAFGKPAIVSGEKDCPLTFNLTHSGDMILYAIAMNRRVGIDVEEVRHDLNVIELARSHFADAEIETILAVSEAEQVLSFFRCWTRKEAFIKARGEGLSFPLDKFAVTLDMSPKLSWVHEDPDATFRWSMFNLEPGFGYTAAVVIEGSDAQLILR